MDRTAGQALLYRAKQAKGPGRSERWSLVFVEHQLHPRQPASVEKVGGVNRFAAIARRLPLALAIVVILGVLGTGLAAGSLYQADRAHLASALNERGAAVALTVSAEINRYVTTAHDLAAAVGAQANLRASEFDGLVNVITPLQLPGITGISLIVAGTNKDIPRIQREWRGRGSDGLVLHPEPATNQHWFMVMHRTTDSTAPTPGRDISAVPEVVGVIQNADHPGAVAFSKPRVLVRDLNQPASQQQLAIVIAAAIYGVAPAPDAGKPRGWIVMGLRTGDFLVNTLARSAGSALHGQFADVTDAPVVLTRWSPAAPIIGTQRRVDQVAGPGRQYQLTLRPTKDLLNSGPVRPYQVAILIGTVLTGMLAALVFTIGQRRKQALRQVAYATAALREDIGRREATEAQLRQRERELAGFAGMVAHDLRSPLAHIAGYVDLLLDDPEHNSAGREYLNRINTGVGRMNTLIEDLLAVAKADNEALRRQSIDLAPVVADILTERADTRDGRPEPIISCGQLAPVYADPILLRQLLDNLIGNAIKYTPAGTAAKIDISSVAGPDGMTHVVIADHGIGIPPEQANTIFQAFQRGAGSEGYPGTGLGLAICARIIGRHGGQIGVETNPGGGSRFWFRLPTGPAPVVTPVPLAQPEPHHI